MTNERNLEGHKRGNINLVIGVLGGVFMVFLMAAIYLLVLASVQGTLTADTAEYNAVGTGITSISDALDLGAVLPIVGFAVGVIAVLGYLRLGQR